MRIGKRSGLLLGVAAIWQVAAAEAPAAAAESPSSWTIGAPANAPAPQVIDASALSHGNRHDGWWLPFIATGNALSATGQLIEEVGAYPAQLFDGSMLLSLPRLACELGVELPTAIVGGALAATGRGIRAGGNSLYRTAPVPVEPVPTTAAAEETGEKP